MHNLQEPGATIIDPRDRQLRSQTKNEWVRRRSIGDAGDQRNVAVEWVTGPERQRDMKMMTGMNR